MTKVQTSVVYEPEIALEGDIANSKPKFAVSTIAEETIKVGRFVKLGADSNKQIKNLASTGDVALGKLVGVSLHDRTVETPALNRDNTGGEGISDFVAYDSVAVMKEGSVYLKPETAMNPSTAVYIRHAGRKQAQTLVFSADLVTSNKINGKVGGVSISEITFASDNATTLAAIAAAILAANANVLSAVSDGTHTITVTTLQDVADQDLTDFVVTLGASQATAAITETASSVHTDNIGRIRNDSDSSTATIAPTGTVRVLDKITAGDKIVPVSINLN